MEGLTNIADMVSVHFSADLSEYWDDRYFACHFINGECNTVFESGAIVPMGPNWGRHSKEWVFHCGFAMDDQNRHDDAALIPRIRQLLKVPDLEMDVHKISHWTIEKVLADKYRVGRVFLAGDAGNCRPPTTGLGLNTAIEDSLNIAWKLALALKGEASDLPVNRDLLGLEYYPTTQPGHRLPHAWIELGDSVMSTHDLVSNKLGFALITDSEGCDWAIAAKNILKNRGVEVVVALIGDKCLYRDYDDCWNGLKEI
ncbi:hypothetical protein AbraIFM66951_007795 [Aspergillus brasiliensis]|nr:hypothetical protein AbraIFM66951_007795 [Aspergillus brasiliensis]